MNESIEARPKEIEAAFAAARVKIEREGEKFAGDISRLQEGMTLLAAMIRANVDEIGRLRAENAALRRRAGRRR
jgi:hypothetical protein